MWFYAEVKKAYKYVSKCNKNLLIRNLSTSFSISMSSLQTLILQFLLHIYLVPLTLSCWVEQKVIHT